MLLAVCHDMNWLMQPKITFELWVFKPAIKNPEIQDHLGLSIGQSVFDQYVFAYISFVYIFFKFSHQCSLSRSGFYILQIPNLALIQTPNSKTNKSEDYVKSNGVLGTVHLCTILLPISSQSMASGALPAHSSRRKAIDLLDVSCPARFFYMLCRRNVDLCFILIDLWPLQRQILSHCMVGGLPHMDSNIMEERYCA